MSPHLLNQANKVTAPLGENKMAALPGKHGFLSNNMSSARTYLIHTVK
jgi:hypothetical protein